MSKLTMVQLMVFIFNAGLTMANVHNQSYVVATFTAFVAMMCLAFAVISEIKYS